MDQVYIDRQLKLAEVLESGKYQQAQEMLRRGNKFCCLGVACCLFQEQTNMGCWLGGSFVVKDDESETHLPDSVYKWYGFESSSPTCSNRNLIGENDDGKSFKDIASYIRNEVAKK